MRAVVQRVTSAHVLVSGKVVGKIKKGLLIFFAVHVNDTEEKVEKMAEKIIKLRIFEDQNSKMNLSLKDLNAEVLVISQFTLFAETKKGNRPSFVDSAKPEKAIPMYEKFISSLREKGLKVETGEFGAKMTVELINDGPVTIILDI